MVYWFIIGLLVYHHFSCYNLYKWALDGHTRLETKGFIGVDVRSHCWSQASQQGVEEERSASRVLAKEASDRRQGEHL